MNIYVGKSQCAGEDNTVTVCDKFLDISNQNFDLFSNLNGMPQMGGTWSTTNSANLDALNINTGTLNLWLINEFGEHQFTYTNGNCGESAIVTLLLGGYSGEDNVDGSANACSDMPTNMFNFLGSLVDGAIPDSNGVWEEDPMTATGDLSGNIFDTTLAGPGEYIFTYTVPDVDACLGSVSTIFLEVHKAPESGDPLEFVVCTTDDLSGFTNLNLNSLLVGEDMNGTWSEAFTNQIDGILDNIINVEEINANFGYGVYDFTYTVLPDHPVCSEASTTISIVILPTLQGNMQVDNYCAGSDYEVSLEYDDSLLPAGTYDLTYRVTSSQGMEDIIISIPFNNGSGTFNVLPAAVPLNEDVDLNIIGIIGKVPERDVCTNIDVPQVSFLTASPSATGESVCPDNEVDIQLQNILDMGGNLSNESHVVNYSLTFPDNTSTDLTTGSLDFTDGVVSFTIPSSNFNLDGSYTVDIEIEDSYDLDCTISTNIEVIPTPEEIQLQIIVDNSCDATGIDVLVDAPILVNGSYTIDYEVVEQNSMEILTDNSINFAGGIAQYEIDIANLPDGDYLVLLQSIQNDNTPCREVFEFQLEESFTIGGTPTVIDAKSSQTFCLNDGLPTLVDVEVNTPGDVVFYENAEDDIPLPLNTLLVNGEDYYIFSENENDNCSPDKRIRIVVSLIQASTPTSENPNPVLCGSENPMLTDIQVSSPNNGSIIWYDSALGGAPLDITETLIDNQSYFAAEILGGFCESEIRLEITPTIVNPLLPDLTASELTLCALDNPTVVELENLEIPIDGVEIEWFLEEEGENVVSSSELLLDDTIYYAQSKDIETGCINLERFPVTVDLNNCDPEKYGFFIPDGFSPNSDGRNDTFYVPNIEIIFPDFTIEIFNRYGNSLFKGDAGNPAWSGSEVGRNMAPNGIYFFIINFNREGFEPRQGRLYLNQ